MNRFMLAEAMAQLPGATAEPGGLGVLFSFLPIVLIFIAFYFLLILPQQKRAKKRRAMLEMLKKGDKVLTTGGILGTVTNLAKESVTLQVAEGVRIKFARSSVEELRGEEDRESSAG